MLEPTLVEVLLSVVLLFNVGAYSLLWREKKRIENKLDQKVSEKEKQISDIKKTTLSLRNRIFGHADDKTNGGHLSHTEDKFKEIESTLEDISKQMESIDENRQKEHKEVRDQIQELIWSLDSEEEIDIEKDDFQL